MPRFSNAFNWRKSTADEHHIGETSPEQSSFRVLERNQPFDGKSFDGGARMNRPGSSLHKPTNSELEPDDNMFAGLNTNRYVDYRKACLSCSQKSARCCYNLDGVSRMAGVKNKC